MNLIIKEDKLKAAEITANELLIEIAVHLYDTGRFSIGQAKNLVGMDHISFQKELAKRDVDIKYDEDDLEKDLKNLKAFHQVVIPKKVSEELLSILCKKFIYI